MRIPPSTLARKLRLVAFGLLITGGGLLAKDPVNLGFGYTRKGDEILFNGISIEKAGKNTIGRMSRTLGRKLTLCHNVDAATFHVLSEEYTKDKNKVYYKWISPGRFWVIELPKADPATFEVAGFNLARDKNHTWHWDQVKEGLDPDTLEVIKDGFVWKDKDAVWYQHKIIKEADPVSFEQINDHYFRDDRQVFWCDTLLPNADAGSFRTFKNNPSWGADDTNVWRTKTLYEGLDSPTFQPVHESIVKDQHGVYIHPIPTLLKNADPKSFEKIADLDQHLTALLKDSRNYYIFLPYRGEVFSLTPKHGVLQVSRTILLDKPGKGIRRIGRSSVELTKDGWQNLKVTTVEKDPKKFWEQTEAHLHKIYSKQFDDAWMIIREKEKNN